MRIRASYAGLHATWARGRGAFRPTRHVLVASLARAIDTATREQLKELAGILFERIRVTVDGRYENEPVPSARPFFAAQQSVSGAPGWTPTAAKQSTHSPRLRGGHPPSGRLRACGRLPRVARCPASTPIRCGPPGDSVDRVGLHFHGIGLPQRYGEGFEPHHVTMMRARLGDDHLGTD